MNILQVAPFFSPKMGGSPQVVYQISKELSRRGHQVTVLAGDYGIKDISFPVEEFKPIILPSVFSKWGFYLTPGIIAWCKNRIKEFDIIHLHEVRTFQNIIVRMYANKNNIPYVLSAHGTLPIIVQRKYLKRFYDSLFGRRILSSAKYLIAVSITEAEQYQEAGFEQGRIRVIHNGVNLSEFSSLPDMGKYRMTIPNLSVDTKIILYFGRLHQRKGIDILIKSMAQLVNSQNKVILLIAGPDEGELCNLQSLTSKLELNNYVRFSEPIYGSSKIGLLRDADVLAYPAVFEIFGLVPFEALMCGTPVIVSDDCGLGEIIRNADAGYLVPYGDVSALAETLKYVLTNTCEAKHKVLSGQKYIRDHLNWQKIGFELEDLYHTCLQQ